MLEQSIADETLPIAHRLSPGSAADDPEGQKLMAEVPKEICEGKPLTMDKAYEYDTQDFALAHLLPLNLQAEPRITLFS